MSIELIIFLALWLISTEVIFFKFAIDDIYDYSSFIENKSMSMFIGFILVFFSFGIPASIATGLGDPEIAKGYIAYVWYYSIVLGVVLFIGANYLIYKKVKKQ